MFFGMLLAVKYITALRVLFEFNGPHKLIAGGIALWKLC